jgi:myo-inositol-1(or 4)-monophosphatase
MAKAKRETKKTPKKTASKRVPDTKASAKPVAKSPGKPVAKQTASKPASTKAPAKKAAPRKAAVPKQEIAAKPAAEQGDVKSPPPVVTPVVTAAKATPKVKVLPREFLLELCSAIREAVLPMVQQVKGREIVGTAPSGDATFEMDAVAERTLLNFLKRAKAPVAYYSEDSGYSTFSNTQPDYLLVVDPIDGSRAARCGFESCVVAVACTRVIERPTVADVDNACVMEIIGNRAFYAERGKGAKIFVDGTTRKPKLSQHTDIEAISWSMTVPARPAELIFQTAARLIDTTSLKGGFFACNSTSYSLTRLLTNQLDACVDFASRYMKDVPEIVRDKFINAGRGTVLGICPYDLVAALLIVEEAGAVVTDAYGKRFDDMLLLDVSENNHQSIIAAANPELHKKLMLFFDTRITQVGQVLRRNEERKKRR